MNKSTRDRLVLPILLPVGLFLAMLALMFSFSRILLNVSSEAATIVALVVASVVLAAAGVIATRKGLAASASLGSLLGIVAGVAMLAGGIALAVAPPGEEAAKGGEGGAAAPFEASITAPKGAAGEGFAVDTLAFPADTPVALTLDNQDPGLQHNVAIFNGDPDKDPAAPMLFEGTFVTGPNQTTYNIKPLPAGTYTFRCSLHPGTMKGTLEVSPGGGGAEGGGGASASIVAKGIQFDTKRLTFEADTPTTLSFDNQDAGTPHNVAIYSDESLSKSLFKGDLVTGPATADYQVPPLPAGTYYFQCDVHPTMSGTVVVKGGAGGAEEPGGGTGPPSAGGAGATGATGATGAATGAAGGGVSVVAKGLAFDTKEITLSAQTETPLAFDNQDGGVPHNLSIYDDPSLPVDPSAPKLFTFTPFPGIDKQELTIPAIPPGTYSFQCDVHPNMTGIVKVT